MTEQATADRIAKAFVAARRAREGFADYPGAMPETLEDAYAIQAKAIALYDAPIAGWKVGRVPDPLVARYGANRLAGPIFADSVVWAQAGGPAEMSIFRNGFGAAEAEYLVRLGALPSDFDRPWRNADILPYVAEMRVGIEIASSPFAGINAHGPAVTISDFGNNNGLLIGYGISSEEDFLNWPVSLTVDGAVVGTGTAGGMLDGPIGAVRFLFERAAQGLPLAEGQWISTGAVTGVHPVRPGAMVAAAFGAGLRVACTIGIA
ncbi:2-keto-4-pentenoate hydratase [Sphingomonas azotifigens]|uniref:2-keto-4-pentenoate hydratase n=1 Tax=Sphingomonas azotifigens TaxID=330920 RepID=UPI000A056CF4|nr:2-keto-4-pentenoate hydratase [Sphingomonas azotifigens]